MEFDYEISIIIPAYNAEKTIESCLNNIINDTKNLSSEIIVIDDCSSDKTLEKLKQFQSIKVVKLKKNKGVGYARNLGARIAKNEILCYIDADLIISKNSILNLAKKLHEDKDAGTVGAIQETVNLNFNNWSSNFVCLKSCFGFEDVKDEIEFTDVHSEFCVMSKKTLKQVGKWKPFKNAGGEEFELGYKIRQFKKKNILIKEASYKTYYASLYLRFKKIIDRTEKYLHVFLKKKEFDTMGSFATSNQAFSSLLSLLIFSLLAFYVYNSNQLTLIIILILYFAQIIVEFKFLIFSKKHFGIKMLFFSLFGIQVINTGIIIGGIYFFLNRIKINKLNKILPYHLFNRIFSLTKEYYPNNLTNLKKLFKLVFYEVFYLLKGYRQSSVTILNHHRFTDNIPCQYYFLHKIVNFLKKNDIKILLDLGCGGGRSIYFFNKKLKINYYGIEYQKHIFEGCKLFLNKFGNIKIYNYDFMSYKFLDLNADCFFINDPLKKKDDFNRLIENIISKNEKNKKTIYFILIDVNENKRQIFNKYKNIDSFVYKTKGYYIYSNEKIL